MGANFIELLASIERLDCTVALVRHAHSSWNGPPKRFQGRFAAPLSAEGVEECRVAAPSVGEKPRRIFCSPALRCVQTATLVYGVTKEELLFDERLWEIDLGHFNGLYEEDVRRDHPEEHRLWRSKPSEVRFGGGETVAEMCERVESFLSDMVATLRSGERVDVVTHAGPIRCALCRMTELPLDKYWNFDVPNVGRVVFSGSREQLLRTRAEYFLEDATEVR